jgi:hypothetical protein
MDGFFGVLLWIPLRLQGKAKSDGVLWGQGVGRFAFVCGMGQEKASLILSSLMVLVEIVPNQ